MVECFEFLPWRWNVASRSIKNRPSIKKKHRFVGFGVFFAVLFAMVIAGGFGLYALGNAWIGDWANFDVSDASALNTAEPTTVTASDENTQLARFQIENRDPVELNQISDYVRNGTVATEDERFYDHGGFDPWGILRATAVTVMGGQEGASTITQQLVRNTILSDQMDDISFARKVREIYLATKMEESYSKDEILLMYLNTVNYGNATYGIQAASQRYFSKNASDLTLSEAAALVGIPQSPTYNEPLGHKDNCIERRNTVLSRMLRNGYITQSEYDQATHEDLVVKETVPSNDGIEAYPYFTSYVRQYLTDHYSQLDIFKGGLTVVTTLDTKTQDDAEAAIRTKEEGLSDAISGSLVAIDPDTGYIRAMVGGKNYYENQTNLATGDGTDPSAPGRPCGSAFKTFTLITAIEAGINPTTLVNCSSPASIPNTEYQSGTSVGALQNIDNINYGTRSIASAFEVSSNTGFVRLEMSLGIDKVIDTAKRMGITSPLAANPSLTLGQSNVTMLDMSAAYATIANGGTYHEPQPVLKVYDSKGNLIVDNSNPQGERILSPEVAHAATQVMKSVVTGYNGTGTDAALSNGQEVAAKTGTSSNYMDITFCGITPQLSVAIWFGDPSNGVQLPNHTSAGDVFRNFMTDVLEGQPTESFPEAGDPSYQSYSDNTYGIGGGSSSSGSGTSSGNSSGYGNGTGSSSNGNSGYNSGYGYGYGYDYGNGYGSGAGTGGNTTGGTDAGEGSAGTGGAGGDSGTGGAGGGTTGGGDTGGTGGSGTGGGGTGGGGTGGTGGSGGTGGTGTGGSGGGAGGGA